MKRLLLGLLLSGMALAAAPVRLENAAAVAEIDPDLGRITVWKRQGGENLLWRNTGSLDYPGLPGWKNHGGDKLWLIPQGFRGFAYGRDVPDPDTDGKPWKVVSQSPLEIVIESPLNTAAHTVSTRRIALDPAAPKLSIENRVVRRAPSPLPIQLWPVTQAAMPRYAILDQAADLFPGEPRFWKMRFYSPKAQAVPLGGDAIAVAIPAGDWDKFGAFGRFVAAVYDTEIFLQSFAPAADGNYPERSTVQYFGNGKYAELETYGSYVNLKPGESDSLTVTWTILPRSKDDSKDDDLTRIRGWRQIGPGGGGRTMWCQPAPGKPDLLMCTGDMGGVFSSRDGGRSWNLMPSREIERVGYYNGNPWEHIPSRPGEVWTHSKTRGLLKSLDYGASWTAVPGAWDALTIRDWHHSLGPGIVRFSPDGQIGLAFWNSFGDGREEKLFGSFDAGATWTEIPVEPGIGVVRGFYFHSPGKVLTVGMRAAWELDLAARTLRKLDAAYPGDVSRTARAGDRILLVSGDKVSQLSFDGKLTPFDFAPDGKKVRVSAIAASGDTIYIGGSSAGFGAFVWKSVDGGKSWKIVLVRDVKKAGCNISRDRWTSGRWGWTANPASIGIDWDDPEFVTFTDMTMCGVSRDGGKSWEIVSTGATRDGLAPGGGTPMLTGWNYYIFGNRHFAATTDFAGWYSDDGGRYWRFAPPEAVWHNNIYAVAADPADPGHFWAAASLKHDLPYWHHLITSEPNLWRGGVIESFDQGATWRAVSPRESGLPDRPATDILADPDGTLHVAILGGGVFRRAPGETAWRAINAGLPEDNRNALRVIRSPGGVLHAVVTARWDGANERAIGGGVYRFDEREQLWRRVELPADVVYPVHLGFSADGAKMFVSCFQMWREKVRRGAGAFAEPGMWIADADGGNARKAFAGAPVFSTVERPGHPGCLVMAAVGQGLKISRDGGSSWRDIPDLPPGNPHTVTFVPGSGRVYVTTFGQGIWTGMLP